MDDFSTAQHGFDHLFGADSLSNAFRLSLLAALHLGLWEKYWIFNISQISNDLCLDEVCFLLQERVSVSLLCRHVCLWVALLHNGGTWRLLPYAFAATVALAVDGGHCFIKDMKLY